MKITQLSVIDSDGKEHTWQGDEGFAIVTSAHMKSEFQGAPAKTYGLSVDAHLIAAIKEN